MAFHVRTGWMIDRVSRVSQQLYARAHFERNLPLWYTSDSTADDLPYWISSPVSGNQTQAGNRGVPESFRDHDEGLLVLPSSYDCGDWRFLANGAGWSSPKDFYEHLVM
jgi:hypothetical protein